MLVVGLTGGIGSGKTVVSDAFAKLGTPVIDTDIIARELVNPGQTALTEIADRFGQDCLLADGSLNRRYLRTVVFSDQQKRAALEAILHPRIGIAVTDQLNSLTATYAIVVIPLLVEKGSMNDLLHRILVVDVPEEMQINRVMARDSIDENQAKAILASQATRAERLVQADDVIENTGNLATLADKVLAFHKMYQKLAQH